MPCRAVATAVVAALTAEGRVRYRNNTGFIAVEKVALGQVCVRIVWMNPPVPRNHSCYLQGASKRKLGTLQQVNSFSRVSEELPLVSLYTDALLVGQWVSRAICRALSSFGGLLWRNCA